MRLHLVALPHTQTTAAYLTCAYTQKVVRFCGMMLERGFEVILYAGEENEAPCTEHVPLLSERERRRWFGANDEREMLGYFPELRWDAGDPGWRIPGKRAVREIRRRAGDRDLLLLTTGWPQKPIAEALPELLACEWTVGYVGVCLEHRVFESYAWMHHVYGRTGASSGAAFDAVIPNFFDPDDFAISAKGDYLLFVGRLISSKGIDVAARISELVGIPLVVAGPGPAAFGEGWLAAPGLEARAHGLRYVGPVGLQDRAALMAGARALLAPTQYLEPFGGVAVEAMLSGTPAVTTDWGAFTETVEPGLTGERFRTLQEGADAVCRALELEPELIRARALERFSLEAVAALYDEHFHRLETLWGAGWAELRTDHALT